MVQGSFRDADRPGSGNEKGTMQALASHSPQHKRRRRPWILALVLVVIVGAGAGIAFAVTAGKGGNGGSPDPGGGGAAAAGSTTTTKVSVKPLTVVTTSPAKGAQSVATNATVTVHFSAPLAGKSPMPSLNPPVAGSWTRTNSTTVVFQPTAPFIPSTTESLTVPGGAAGVVSSSGAKLTASTPITFTIAQGSTQRLQQLLAQLGYLPLSYTPPTPAPAPADMAMPQVGTLAWRWPNTPPTLSALWIQGQPNIITKSAVENFQNQNGLTVDGLAGPKVWSALLADVGAAKGDPVPYTYVLVTKTQPQHLTVFVNGSVQLANILVNTGAPGADTVDGTFPVFEHVKASEMKGTNVTGSTYDDPTVPWASYFNGGDALHGFVRANYGYPQSNGCVEMTIANAAQVWPLTPIGTLVTVVGPPS